MDYNIDVLGKQLRSQFSAENGQVPDLTTLYEQVGDIVSQSKLTGDIDGIARKIVDHVGVNDMLPESYAKFQPLVTESLVFVLMQLPAERLAKKIVDQLVLDPHVTRGRRVFTLINDMPSLQKLGQIICRAPGLAPEFKHALIELEDNVGTVAYEELLPFLKAEIQAIRGRYAVDLEDKVLAEASVCAVVAANVRKNIKKRAVKAVLKTLKPKVRQNLSHELNVLNELALFLDKNKDRWGLGDFKFKDTLEQVQWLLKNETNLTLEQENLEAAGRYYRKTNKLIIPRLMPCSTPGMTVMTLVKGRKITDVDGLDKKQKRVLARTLAEMCILRPMKDLGDETIFHGDPHAGNIAYEFVKSKPRIIFYDWGMMGGLSRLERFAFALISLGVMAKSTMTTLLAIDIVSGGQIFSGLRLETRLHGAAQNILSKRKNRTGYVLADIGVLFRELSFHGIVFPTNLLMFQKALVTLNGVIADIDPDFNSDDQLVRIAIGSYLRDLFRPGYYGAVYKEMWTLGRYGAGKFLDLQRLMFRLAIRLGIAGVKIPFWLVESSAIPVSVRK